MSDIWDAAEAGDLAEVQRLIGEDPSRVNSTRGPYGPTPLMSASRAGQVEVVRWLLDQGAVLDQQDKGWETALFYASRHGRTPVVRLLLERGADPTVASTLGSIPLVHASSGGHIEIVRCLLGHPSAAATINQVERWGQTALWFASANGRVRVVRALLEQGADPTIASRDGRTPMAAARQYRRPACLEALQVRARFPASVVTC
jgi:ankyrin repeat protein